jgi:hypothetical protein
MLRTSFNAMFVNLSRRSQTLIERLARTIDSLEQNEQDPDRLSYLFLMDHLVTRMRRNSENLLLLAGHDSARRWSEPVSLADVIRAATSEIEQYARVALSVQPGIWISGQAVSDIVRLLAEIIENATTFSPKDTQVRVSAQGLNSGGALIEVSDSGLGLSEARLTEINSRLTNPPVIDVSVSRHMGLFAVERLAERHGVRVRMRAGSPRGLTALVWLPGSLTEQETGTHGGWSRPRAAQADFPASRTVGRHSMAVRSASDGRSAADRPDTVAASTPMAASAPETVQAAALATSEWFRSPRSVATPTGGGGDGAVGAAPQPGGGRTADTYEWAEGRHAAQIIANPVRGGEFAGLPVRVPQANLIPGSAGRGRQADIGVTSRPADDHEAQTPAASRLQRSPEMARRRLSGFQRGTRRAEGQTPRTTEEADR